MTRLAVHCNSTLPSVRLPDALGTLAHISSLPSLKPHAPVPPLSPSTAVLEMKMLPQMSTVNVNTAGWRCSRSRLFFFVSSSHQSLTAYNHNPDNPYPLITIATDSHLNHNFTVTVNHHIVAYLSHHHLANSSTRVHLR